MTEYKFHPVSDIFPLMEGEPFDALKEDIRRHGQLVPIVVLDGQILDGRNRYRACLDLGIEPRVQPWDGGDSRVDYVQSVNLHRRHLDESGRAMAAARSIPHYEEEARQRQAHGRTAPGKTLRANWPEAIPDNGRARDHAGAALHVSPRTVERASKVLKDGVPELVKAVDAGKVAVSAAAEVAKLPPAEQKEVVSRGPKAVRKKAKAVREKAQDTRTADERDEDKLHAQEKRWLDGMHRLWVLVNGVRDLGGIAKVTEFWTPEGKLECADQLKRIREILNGWIEFFEKG